MRMATVVATLFGAMALRVLLVDDNVQFLAVARGLLEREGLTVVAVATTSDDARRYIDEVQPDLVLIDVDLGEENGLDLAQTIVRGREAEAPLVILMSAYPEDDLADLLGTCPNTAFLSKSELSMAAITAILRRRPS